MATKPEKKFCVEHSAIQEKEDDEDRTPCPYDPKHTCSVSKMRKHLKKCNSRPKELPEYIVPKINALDTDNPNCQDEMYPIGSVPDDVLLDLIRKIEKVYTDDGLECETRILRHDVMEAELEKTEYGMQSKKHLIQNSSLLKNMEENGFLENNFTFIEFGAGRAKFGYWISQATKNNENCLLILVDKESHRHKCDNLKDVSRVSTQRIRADIADLELAKIPLVAASGNDIIGVTKHLCGGATDLALRCINNGRNNGLNIIGVVMAFCCHHRCTWSTFVGKKYLQNVGFTPNEFSALCSISSWATCGSGRPRLRKEEPDNADNNRYKKFGLTQDVREIIGRKCKMILNQARLKYLQESGYEGKLIYYVEQKVSPENVCVIAKLRNKSK